MLPKEQRMRRSDFRACTHWEGEKIKLVSRSLIFQCCKGEGNTRIGIVISKKGMKSSVQRKKLKRRIYHSIRARYPQLHNCRFVIIRIKRGVQDLSFSEIERELGEMIGTLQKRKK